MYIDRTILTALILFIALVLVFFLVSPEFRIFKDLQTELGIKTAEYNAQFEYYAAISRTYNDLQAVGEDLKKIDDALPTDPAYGKAIYFLQKTAKENGLLVKNLFLAKSSPTAVNPNLSGNVKDIVFSADLSGNYEALESFIVALEKSARIFEITNISFSSTSDNFNLQIKTHSY